MTPKRMSWHKWSFDAWDNDPALALCSLQAQALWMRMLCIAAQSEGYVKVGGKAATAAQIGLLCRPTLAVEEAENLIAELAKNRVFSRTRKGVIYSRRMVRDAETHVQQSAFGKLGGNPSLTKDRGNSKGLKAVVRKGLKIETETETEKDTPIVPKGTGDLFGGVNDNANPFDAFWGIYPRKSGKLAAERAFVRAIENTGVTAELIIAAVKRVTWPTEARFIPHPATWLNQGRFYDEHTTASRKTVEWC